MDVTSPQDLVAAVRKLRSAVHTNGISWTTQRAMWTKICLGVVVVLCFVVSASADFVSGRVFGPDGKILPNATLEAENGANKISFTTDNSGSFSVYLDPGTYTVHVSTDSTVEGIIHGYPQSATEDIRLKKR